MLRPKFFELGYLMKQVIAIVKPFLAERVLNAIAEFTIDDLTVREAKGFGRQKKYLELYRNNEFSLIFVAKVEISFIADETILNAVIDRITAVSRTGRLGDGKIMVVPIHGDPISING